MDKLKQYTQVNNKDTHTFATIRTHTYQLFRDNWRRLGLRGKERYTWQWGASINVDCDLADTEQQAIENVIEQLEDVLTSIKMASLAQKEKIRHESSRH